MAGRGGGAAFAHVLLDGESLIAAFLPELARDDAMGRVSGRGWSFGYLGGMLALGLGLAYVATTQARGEPAMAFVPVVMLITTMPIDMARVQHSARSAA